MGELAARDRAHDEVVTRGEQAAFGLDEARDQSRVARKDAVERVAAGLRLGAGRLADLAGVLIERLDLGTARARGERAVVAMLIDVEAEDLAAVLRRQNDAESDGVGAAQRRLLERANRRVRGRNDRARGDRSGRREHEQRQSGERP